MVAALSVIVAMMAHPVELRAVQGRPVALVSSDPATPASDSPLLPLTSLAIPGTAQLIRGQDRGVGYLVWEAILVAWYLQSRDQAHRARERYRSLAFVVARQPFMPAVRDTVFEYFEQMAKYVESGPFDAGPEPGIQPPIDETSFNGSIWALARQTFFHDPDNPPPLDSEGYRAALAFYSERAVGPNFRWSWSADLVAMQQFTGSIRESDEAVQRGTTALALVFLNHLASTIDAHISGQMTRVRPGVRLQSSISLQSMVLARPRLRLALVFSF